MEIPRDGGCHLVKRSHHARAATATLVAIAALSRQKLFDSGARLPALRGSNPGRDVRR
jgi:hypothetical protein